MRILRVITIGCGFAMTTLMLTVAIARAAEDTRDENQLIEVLKSDAPKQDKALVCKRLAVFGTREAVPMLAELLDDEELASWALIALEAIPDPACDEALRDSLDDLDGRLLVGVIHSIGVRQDVGAVDGLVKHLTHSDPRIVAAAAYSLGKIGNTAAATALAQALNDVPDGARSPVAEGCVLCAERLLAEGRAGLAAELCDKVRGADVSKQRVLEATRGAILARQADGLPLLVEQFRSSDDELFSLAIRTSREIPGADISKALVSELPNASPARQVLLIHALSHREEAVLPAILEAAQSGSPEVRAVALRTLRRVGDASCVPVLLKVAAGDDSSLAASATQALEALPGKDVDQDISDRLGRADGELRRALIELVGLRRIDAVPALIKAADDDDAGIRSAALASLGSTVGPGDLAVLISRVASPTMPGDTPVAIEALRTACVRMPDPDACASQLHAALADAPDVSKIALLETIGNVGGRKALESVAAAAQGKHPELRDTASQLLGKWMTTDAAPVLLDLANSTTEEKYKIRALRGYIRLVRQFSFPVDQRIEMCRDALDTAHRDPERVLVLEVLERYPSIKTLELAVETAKTDSVKDRASRSAVVIAKKLGGETIDVNQLLEQVGQRSRKIEILEANYGAGDKMKDVTSVVRQHAGKIPVVFLPSTNYNASFGGDPAPGVRKKLTIRYKMDGTQGEASFAEGDAIFLPNP